MASFELDATTGVNPASLTTSLTISRISLSSSTKRTSFVSVIRYIRTPRQGMESRARLQARGRRGTRRMHYSFEHHSASRLSEPQYCRQSARVVLHLHKGRIQLSPRPSSRLLVFRPPFIEAD